MEGSLALTTRAPALRRLRTTIDREASALALRLVGELVDDFAIALVHAGVEG
jgi:hypothetical protein